MYFDRHYNIKKLNKPLLAYKGGEGGQLFSQKKLKPPKTRICCFLMKMTSFPFSIHVYLIVIKEIIKFKINAFHKAGNCHSKHTCQAIT